MWAGRQHCGLKSEKGDEKAGVAPEKMRSLGLDDGACELVTGDVTAASAACCGKRKENDPEGVRDYRRLLKSEGFAYQEQEERYASDGHAEKDCR